MDSEKFLRAVELYKNRDHQNATQLLAEMIKEEPNNPDAWYLLALCTNELRYKQYCLQKALEINPQHQGARAALNKLDDHVLKDVEQGKPAEMNQIAISAGDWPRKT
jgi:predicted Zn-dependent protease